MSNEMLEKVIRTTEIGAAAGGLLSAEQSNRFLDYMFDATVLGRQVRTVRMRANEQDIDKVRVGERIVRGATEAVDTGENAGATFSKISLTTRKLRLDWELSTESLEDNIEGGDLEDHLARLMATQAGNDIEDLAINGDVTSTDPLLKQFDGWRKQAVNGLQGEQANVVAANADGTGTKGLDLEVFSNAVKALPRKFRQRRTGLRFFVGSNFIQDYLMGFVDSGNAALAAAFAPGIVQTGPNAAEGDAGFTTGNAFGFPIVEVPLLNTSMDFDGRTDDAEGEYGDVWFTYPQNLLWGVKREIEVYREFKPKKDAIEYTMYCRVGTRIENAAAMVVVTDIRAS